MVSRRLMIVLILAILPSTLNFALPQADKDGVIEVTLSSSNGVPLAGGLIVLQGPITQTVETPFGPFSRQMPPEVTATSDKNGRATFRGIAPGQYYIRAQKDGYLGYTPAGSGLPPGIIMPTEITVQAGQTPLAVSLSLVRGVTVSGTITDATGEPLANVLVYIGTLTNRNGRRIFQSSINARTDDQGKYRLFWLAPGEYYLLGQMDQGMARMKAVGYSMAYYPGVIGITKAKQISIASSENLTGIDFALQKVDTHRVTGKLVNLPAALSDRPASPMPSFAFVPGDPNEPDLPMYQSVQSRLNPATGEFEVLGIPPGSWNLYPMITPATGPATLIPSIRYITGHASVDVKDKDIDGVTITVGAIAIKGKVVAPNLAFPPPSGFAINNIRVSLQPCDSAPTFLMAPVQASRLVGPDGGFEILAVPPGKYSIVVSTLSAPLYVADLRVGSKSVFNDGTITVGSKPLEPIQVILGAEGTSISGTITGFTLETTISALYSTRVVLIPASPRRKSILLYKSAQVNNLNGFFSFYGIAPGEYKVLAIQGLPQGMEMDPETIARYESRAQSVTVASGGRISNLQVEWIRNAK